MSSPRILIIDDEDQIRRLLEITLTSNDYLVSEASTAAKGILSAVNHPPDLIILDIGLPDMSGHEVLKKLREWYSKPIFILSVLNNEIDIVEALDNGANDYLVKPFRTGELLARIRSALKVSGTDSASPLKDYGDLKINLSTRRVTKENLLVKLTSTEYSLLCLLANNEGKVLTHHYILREIWGPGFISQSQYLRVFIAQLRKKIETDPNRPQFITTEQGVGYRFISTLTVNQ